MQQALRCSNGIAQHHQHSRLSAAPSSTRRAAVLTRASPDDSRSKPTREYREDTGKIVLPGDEQKQQALYADQAATAKKKDNLSREMKQRLRQEYYGLGGAENTVSMPSRGMFVVAAAATAEPATAEPAAASTAAVAEPITSSSSSLEEAEQPAAAQRSGSSTGSKWVIDENEVLHSTFEHRAWTYGCLALLAGGMAEAASHAHSLQDAGVVGGAVLAAYVLSDLGTAVFHHAVDNYGDANTPVLGKQIAAFQGHHQRPWTITQREFANNVHQVFKPAVWPSAIILVASPWLPLYLQAFLPSFTLLCCMSQQFHAWSHMKKSQLPALVVALQDANLLIGRKAHGAHHKPNFEGNYSIVSGWWNPLLDNTGFFRGLEKAVAAVTGVEPRCWYPPEHGWEELQQPGQQQ